MAYGREDRAPRRPRKKYSGKEREGSGLGFAGLAGLNKKDRDIVEGGTAFGKKHGLDTARGIEFGDLRRFNRIDPDVVLGAHPGSISEADRMASLRQLSNAQLIYGQPVGITDAMAHRKSGTSQHQVGNAFDLAVPPENRARMVQAAAEAGFGGIGTYGAGDPMVHVDTRQPGSAGYQGWGPDYHYGSSPDWQRQAIAEGRAAGPPSPEQWAAIAANNQGASPYAMAALPQRADVPPGQQPTAGGTGTYTTEGSRRQVSPEMAQGPIAATQQAEEAKNNAYWRNLMSTIDWSKMIPQTQTPAPVSGIIEPPPQQPPQPVAASPLQGLGAAAPGLVPVDPAEKRREEMDRLLARLNDPLGQQ